MKNMRTVVVVLLTIVPVAYADQPRPAASTSRSEPDPAAGRAAYVQSCARCHGIEGHGDGLDAKRFYPRPRDFTAGVYKFRSTASGTPPTDEDLFLTITRGLPGSNMPDWQHLDEATRWQLVAYLKSLSTKFQETPPQPVTVAPDPGPRRVDLQKGKTLYTQLGCAACHGVSGRANGPSAPSLVDDWNQPIRPANLTQGWNYRGWSDPGAIMLRVLTGIDGTPMPSYADAVSPEDAWQLAYYVASLQEPTHWNMIVAAHRIQGDLPATVEDPRWEAAERTDLRMRNVVAADGTWVEPPTADAVHLQVVYNTAGVAFRCAWDDPTQDAADASPDAFALIMKPQAQGGDVVTLQAWPYQGAPRLDLGYWSAETGQAYETVAADFESVIRRQVRQALLASAARYEDGRWQVVVQRPLARTSLEQAAAFAPGQSTAVAVAVWDGAHQGARAVSPWVDIVFPDEHAH